VFTGERGDAKEGRARSLSDKERGEKNGREEEGD